jgi:hypothetical protein
VLRTAMVTGYLLPLLSGFSLFSEKPDLIRTPDGREIGRIEQRHGKLIARDVRGRELGSYDPKRATCEGDCCTTGIRWRY